ncbi:adenylate cyclase [Alkalidesulfovibrio alkalitolerans DSM 16529]|uniref:Adenylate cyclase n=1 Tax=Alkalidesulfovibrio alkalitolerans DSM 16529 TaxID=1121439 RepID=S7UKQ4_9BACT|nr:class I adenylate cyclase [Alkalidesulfovibrio alkalitolerans]EPR34424.1 adenylate cyclase [Alkalidesulfovibrio alkalitolerans DSM 16529]
MSQERSRHESAAAAIRAYVHTPPPKRLWSEVARLAEGFAEGPKEGEDAREFARSTTEAAVAVFGLGSRADDPALIDICLRSLVRMGVMGRILAIDLIEQEKLPFDDVAAILADMPDSERWLLFNRILLSPWRTSRELREFALESLTLLRDSLAVDAARLLRALATARPRAAYAVRRALLDGTLGPQLTRMAEADTAPLELLDMCQHLAALSHQGLAEKLAALAARTANPDHAHTLLRAVADLGPRPSLDITRPVARLLGHENRDLALTALETLARCAMPRLGKVTASLYAKRPSLKKGIIARLPLMPAAERRAFMDCVPARELPAVQVLCFLLLGAIDPVNMERCLSIAAHGDAPDTADEDGRDMAVGGVLDELLVLIARVPHAEPAEPQNHASPPEPAHPRDGTGRGRNAPTTTANGPLHLDMKGESPKRFTATGRHLPEPVASATTFHLADFSRATLERGRFEACVFDSCSFDHATLKDMSFIDCSFVNCALRDAALFRCDLTNCVFSLCALTGTAFSGGTMTVVKIECGSMTDALFTGMTLRTCSLRALDLSGAEMNRLKARGLELSDCHAESARLSALTLRTVDITACTFVDCAVDGLDSDDPVFGELADQTLLTRLRRSAKAFETGRLPASPGRAAMAVAFRAVDEWFKIAERKGLCRPFLAHNERRISWAKQKLGAKASEFFDILPLLLHSEFFDHAIGLYPTSPPCRVTAYQPGHSALDLARRYFPTAALPDDRTDAVPIEAIYTIGSLGTVAQSEDSDIDYWLCCALDQLAEQDVEGLHQKCEAIQDWAAQEFGLEVHFFLMDSKRVRENNFGASDSESSGTAQAAMLKEEFYRTAVHVAGKKPVWWLAPPGADQAGYDEAMHRLASGEAGGRFLDLGHVPEIPVGEFFGASLWQIAKAIKSPFKSIMKFGLLEKYVSRQGKTELLLCDRLKANLLGGHDELWRIDPYVMLFLEVAEYYADRGEAQTVELIKMSFLLKSHIAGEAFAPTIPSRAEEKSMRRFFTRGIGARKLAFTDLGIAKDWSLARMLEVGERVNAFILNTYLRVREMQNKQPQSAQANIDPHDLTKLGRKIFAVFAPRKHKIDRLGFVKTDAAMVGLLTFAAETRRGGGQAFVAQGGQMDPRTRRVETVEIKRAKDLCWLVAFIEANGLFAPGLTVKTDFTLSPVIARDVEELLQALAAFFPHAETFETNIEEGLSPERVTRALFVLNLTLPRETPRIRQVSLVYSTNWGEMFCQTVDVSDDAIITDPHAFLAAHVEQDCVEPPLMSSFVPDRAACPGIRFARRPIVPPASGSGYSSRKT